MCSGRCPIRSVIPSNPSLWASGRPQPTPRSLSTDMPPAPKAKAARGDAEVRGYSPDTTLAGTPGFCGSSDWPPATLGPLVAPRQRRKTWLAWISKDGPRAEGSAAGPLDRPLSM